MRMCDDRYSVKVILQCYKCRKCVNLVLTTLFLIDPCHLLCWHSWSEVRFLRCYPTDIVLNCSFKKSASSSVNIEELERASVFDWYMLPAVLTQLIRGCLQHYKIYVCDDFDIGLNNKIVFACKCFDILFFKLLLEFPQSPLAVIRRSHYPHTPGSSFSFLAHSGRKDELK